MKKPNTAPEPTRPLVMPRALLRDSGMKHRSECYSPAQRACGSSLTLGKNHVSKSLQQEFIESRGAPVVKNGRTVFQLDRVPVRSGSVSVRFLSPSNSGPAQGVRLDAGKKGTIALPDGSFTQRLYIWNRSELPPFVSYRVVCPSGFLSVCNLYEIRLSTGETIEEKWTGNAGMVVVEDSVGRKRYECSNGIGEFDLNDLIFEVSWENEKTA